jgi:hypothetical protein
MAEHRILTRVPSHEVINADLVVEVRHDGELLGELLVSRGTIDWRPKGHRQVFELEWEQFDDLMRERGRKRSKG